MSKILELDVNGQRRRFAGDPKRTLLSVLRDDLGLTGSKYGCGEGQCGACTVLVDGRPVRSCVTRVGDSRGRKITTIEGLAPGDELHPVQRAFLDADALQCGYCTPGMILSAVGLLGKTADPSAAEIGHWMEGNICRCGTYPRIVRAIRSAAQAMKGGRR